MPRHIDPNIQYEKDGKPIVGGKAYFGVVDQDPKLNPITIFSDNLLTVPITNPQDTDSQGHLVNQVYVGVNQYSYQVDDNVGGQLSLQLSLEPLNVQGLVTANIAMNGFKHIDVGDADANDQYGTFGQNNKLYTQVVNSDAASTADAIVANLPVSPLVLGDGQQIRVFLAHGSNTITTPTFKLNAFAAKIIFRKPGNILAIGDTGGSSHCIDLVYRGALDQYELLNPLIAKTANIETNAVTNVQIATDTILSTNIATNAVTNVEIATDTILASNIAPNAVGQSEIAASAVHSGELSTSTVVIGLSAASAGTGAIGTNVEINTAGVFRLGNVASISSLTAGTEFWFNEGCGVGTIASNVLIGLCAHKLTAGAGTATGSTTTTFVDASPPYNNGDGDIALFIFLKLDKVNNITSYSVANTPPWAYNGPTSLVPTRTYQEYSAKGKKVGALKKYTEKPDRIILPPWQGGDLEEYLEGPTMVEVEIDNAIKNADMDLIPHPFLSLKDGETVVLVEPCSSLTDNLAILHHRGDNIGELFKSGHLVLDSKVECFAPIGVNVMSAKWK